MLLAIVGAAAAFLLAVVLLDRAITWLGAQIGSRWLIGVIGVRPEVRMHGWGLLPQVLAGHYDDIEVSAADARLGDFAGADIVGHLYGVRCSIVKAAKMMLGKKVDEVECDRLHGICRVPYDQLSQFIGLDLSHDAGRLVATTPIPIPGLGMLGRLRGDTALEVDDRGVLRLRVNARSIGRLRLPSGLSTVARVRGGASVKVAEDGRIRMQVNSVAVGGVPVPGLGLLASELMARFGASTKTPAKQFDFRFHAIGHGAKGLTVEFSASDVVLRVQKADRRPPVPMTVMVDAERPYSAVLWAD